uniref:Uncharacterized protein n=1 Tax=Nymphaea colorata TaxID=210225 RepID=A0A5K1BP59_9MAGN
MLLDVFHKQGTCTIVHFPELGGPAMEMLNYFQIQSSHL